MVYMTNIFSAGKHYLSVHVAVIEGRGRINTHFYALIPLGEDQTGEMQFNQMKERFEADGVWNALKANMVAIILDGAPVNLGKDKGIAKRFEDAFKPRHITVVHCANHRMELVFHHAMDNYADLIKIEQEANHVYRFYHKSPKRELDLSNYGKDIGETVVKLNKIITTR